MSDGAMVALMLIPHAATMAAVLTTHVLTRRNLRSIEGALMATTEKEALARGRAEGYATGHTEGRVEGIRESRAP